MTQESNPRSLQQLADDLKRVRSQAVEETLQHATTRAGLKIVDKIVEPICDGASEDEYLTNGPGRLRRFLFGWIERLRQRRRERAEAEREFRLLNYRLKTLLDQASEMKQQISLGARVIAQQEQRAQVRLKQLENNHAVLRDTLNAHADVIDAQSKAITELQNKVK